MENIRIDSILEKISSSSVSQFDKLGENLGLASGKLGLLIFLAYYAEAKNSNEMHNFVNNKVDEYFSTIPWTNLDCNYIDGLCGILNSLFVLSNNKILDIEIPDDIKRRLENLIFFLCKNSVIGKRMDYEFFYGYSGIGVYGITSKSEKLIEIAFNHINTTKITDGSSFKWKQTMHNIENNDYNISMSHGMSSIIMFLCKYHQYTNINCLNLVEGAINYLLNQQIDFDNYGSCFPSLSKESSKELTSSRLAYCYGDLGQALALWYAGKTFNNKHWKNKAIECFNLNTTRKEIQNTSISDAGLCHGTSGVAQIYRRMFLETDIPLYKDTSDYWIKKTLDYSIFEDGYAGYKALMKDKYEADAGFLMGIAGIGLTLLASNNNPLYSSWDNLLLISI